MSELISRAQEGRRLPSRDMAVRIRKELGITQQQLADELGVHRVTLARWESGVRAPRGEDRARYARLLGDLQKVLAA